MKGLEWLVYGIAEHFYFKLNSETAILTTRKVVRGK